MSCFVVGSVSMRNFWKHYEHDSGRKIKYYLAGALFSVAVSPLFIIAAAVIVMFLFLKHRQGRVGEKYKVKDKTEGNVLKTGRFYFLSLFSVLLFYTFFTNIDLITVKHFFPAYKTGIYSVADILGKIILYFPSAIVLVMFPSSHMTSKPFLFKSVAA